MRPPAPARLTAQQALDQILGRCPPHARAVIGPLAQALLPALRPAPARPAAGPGAPDGLVGWARRGPMHRLVHSEWALLDAAPEEFLRRAADQELAFLELAAEAPRPPRLPVALLDAGPAQLGLPRLAQAAALAARGAWCAAAGEPLRWGAIQGGPAAPGWLALGLDGGWFARLRGLRSLNPADAERMRAAEAALSAEGLGAPLLLVGARTAHPIPDAEIIVLQTFEGAEGPGVELLREGAPLRRWAAPPEAWTAFGPPPASAPAAARQIDEQHALHPGFFFCPSGARLLGLTTDGDAIAVPIPSADGPPAAKLHLRRLEGTAVALGWIGGKIASLCYDAEQDQLRLDLRGRVSVRPRPRELNLPLHEEDYDEELWDGVEPGYAPLGLLASADDGAGALVLPQPGARIFVQIDKKATVPYGWPAELARRGDDGALPGCVVLSHTAPPRALHTTAQPLQPHDPPGQPWALTAGRATVALIARPAPHRQLAVTYQTVRTILPSQRGARALEPGVAVVARLWTACRGPHPRAWAATERRDKAGSASAWELLGLTLPEHTATIWGVLQPEQSPLMLVEEEGVLRLRSFGRADLLVECGPLRWAAASPRGDAVAYMGEDNVLHVIHPLTRARLATLRPPRGAA